MEYYFPRQFYEGAMLGDFGTQGAGMRNSYKTAQYLHDLNRQMTESLTEEKWFRRMASSSEFNPAEQAYARTERLLADRRFANVERQMAQQLELSFGDAGTTMRSRAVLPRIPRTFTSVARTGATRLLGVGARVVSTVGAGVINVARAAVAFAGPVLAVLGVIATVAAIGYGIYKLVTSQGTQVEALPTLPSIDTNGSSEVVDIPSSEVDVPVEFSPLLDYAYPKRDAFSDPNFAKIYRRIVASLPTSALFC